MSINIVLNTTNAYSTNTAGKDYTWAFNFNSFGIEDGEYEMTWCGYTTNVALVSFATVPNPIVNLDIGTLSKVYEADTCVNNHTSQIIGVFKPVIVTPSTVSCFQSEIHSNPPVTFKTLNKSINFIRVYITQAGTNTLVGTSLVNWSMILRFKKV